MELFNDTTDETKIEGYDIEGIQKLQKIEKANEIHNKIVEENSQKVLETITETHMSDDEIKRLESQIIQIVDKASDNVSKTKLKDIYFSKVFTKDFQKPQKQYKLAIIDENNNVLLELKNLENIVKIATLAKGI